VLIGFVSDTFVFDISFSEAQYNLFSVAPL